MSNHPNVTDSEDRAPVHSPHAELRATTGRPAPRARWRQVAQLGFDIGAPILLYYVLHGAGVSNLLALTAGAALLVLGATYTLLIRRHLDTVAVFMVATMLATILISVISHSPRFLLAKDGLITSLWGAWFLASVRARRPAAFTFARPLMEGMTIYAGWSWDDVWDAEPRFRRIWRVSSVVWGAGLLIDAAARVSMSYTLPVDAVPGLGGLLYPVTFVVLQIVTNIYYSAAGLHRLLGARWLRHSPLLSTRQTKAGGAPQARSPARVTPTSIK